MKITAWDAIEKETLSPFAERRVIHSERMTTAKLYLKKGAVVPRHSHDNEQISHILDGKLLFQFDGEDRTVSGGEVVVIPPNEPHRVEALEDSVAMDIFAPIRADWLSGDDAYLRNPSGS